MGSRLTLIDPYQPSNRDLIFLLSDSYSCVTSAKSVRSIHQAFFAGVVWSSSVLSSACLHRRQRPAASAMNRAAIQVKHPQLPNVYPFRYPTRTHRMNAAMATNPQRHSLMNFMNRYLHLYMSVSSGGFLYSLYTCGLKCRFRCLFHHTPNIFQDSFEKRGTVTDLFVCLFLCK